MFTPEELLFSGFILIDILFNCYYTGSKFYKTLSSNSKLKTAYDAILSNMRAHEKSPKFDAASVTLNGYGKSYGKWLTDDNGIISHDIWSVSTDTPGFKVEQNGDRIFLYAPENGGAQPGTSVSIKLTRNIKTSTGSALCSQIGDQACITGSPPDPLDVRVKAEFMPNVTATITKEVKGTSGSSALRKKTFFVFEGWSNYQKWHDDTSSATCNQYVAAWLKTDENGTCSSSAQLQVGKNYYILEALDESNIVRYEENGVSYVTDIFRRNANYPQMTVTGADASSSGAVVKPMDGKMYVYGQMIALTPQSGRNVAIVCNNEITPVSASITKVYANNADTPNNRTFRIYEGYTNYKNGNVFAALDTADSDTANVQNLVPGVWYYIAEDIPDDCRKTPTWSVESGSVMEWKTSGSQNDGTVLLIKPKANTQAKITCENFLLFGSVDILKQDSAGQPLDGVVFRLEVEENGQWQLVSDQTTVDGKAAWSELPVYQTRQTEDGTVLDWITYRLTEIQTVDGNQLLGKPVFEGTFEDKLDEESQTYHLSYCVLNTPGFQMPPAGESGNLWLSVLGLCGMVACGGAMALLMRRKRWKPL